MRESTTFTSYSHQMSWRRWKGWSNSHPTSITDPSPKASRQEGTSNPSCKTPSGVHHTMTSRGKAYESMMLILKYSSGVSSNRMSK